MHTLLLQKLVHGSIFFAWIIHESEDGTKHVFTLLVVEMVRGIFLEGQSSNTPNNPNNNLKLVIIWYPHYQIITITRLYANIVAYNL